MELKTRRELWQFRSKSQFGEKIMGKIPRLLLITIPHVTCGERKFGKKSKSLKTL